MGQCTECKHYDSRPEGGGAVCKTVGVSGMYARDARALKGPCKPEGILFSARLSSTDLQIENTKLREKLVATERSYEGMRESALARKERAEAAEAKLKALGEQPPAYWVYEWFGIDDTATEETWNREVSDAPVSSEDGYRNIEPLYAEPKPPADVQELQRQVEVMRDALARLGEHDQRCDVFDYDEEGAHKECTCGYAKALSIAPSAALREIEARTLREFIEPLDNLANNIGEAASGMPTQETADVLNKFADDAFKLLAAAKRKGE